MAWIPITNAEIDPESPGTTGLFSKYRDNQEALYDGWAMIVKPANEGPFGAGLQDDDDLKITVAANQIWQFEMVLLITTTAFDFQFDFTFPVGTTYMITHDARLANATVLAGYTTEASGATTFVYGGGGATAEPAFFRGWIDTTAALAGTFQLQWAQVGGGAGVATVLAGSYIVAHQDYSTI